LPSEAGWLDLLTTVPTMDTSRARDRLGWTDRVTATDAVRELLDGIGDGAGGRTVPLHPRRHDQRDASMVRTASA
jgi:hypothetical protein